MSFDRRDVRKAMDVFTADNVYLGTVLHVEPRLPATAPEQAAAPAQQSSLISGETLGPMPTLPIGNRGPRTQSAAEQYGTGADDTLPLALGSFTVGHWWGLIGRRRIPIEAVQSVSLERVVLRARYAELDHMRPS